MGEITYNKFKESVFNLFKSLFRYELQKKVVFKSNKYLGISFLIYCILVWILITCWVLYNKGHIKANHNIHSTVVLSIKGSFETNYTKDDFNNNTVKPNEYENYNQVWDYADFVVKSSQEIQVMTNVVITANQTQSTCAETPQLVGYVCNETNNKCRKGKETPHGIQTGRCVRAELPHWDEKKYTYNLWTCQIKGWCPVDRTLTPLKNDSAVLIKTANTTLWIYNTVEFPEFNLILDNVNGYTTTQLINCEYNPISNPHCPVFRLKDIIKYSQNADATYEVVAKFGAVINININYNCFLNSFWKASEDNCKASYSFRRVDTEKKVPNMGYTTYRYAHYFNNGKQRTFFHSYRIRFIVIVNAKVSKYDFFEFVTHMCAFDSIFAISLFIFACFVKLMYRKSDITENI